jgi:hypothetical protein
VAAEIPRPLLPRLTAVTEGKKERNFFPMAKDDNFPFRYDSNSNTVFKTTGNKDVPVVRTKPHSKSWINTFFDLGARYVFSLP